MSYTSNEEEKDFSQEEKDFSQEEMEEIEEAFNCFALEKTTINEDQKGPQGLLLVHDLGYTMKELGFSPTEAEIFEMLDEFDLQKTEYIDFNTFVYILKKNTKPLNEEQLRSAFDVFDKDRNGHIATQEIKFVTRNLGERYTDTEIEEMMKEADADGDGRISYDDFAYFMTKR
ncbi:hypothetical protein HHI36_012411 [Cryptolaemus montrouzieri]|uniref:EF-hand domain-containing protein n=1 Tax=Cryptolaemus montrouzieri TaxID=559131 RepID=A0ABD2NE56_9CUCU